MGKFSFVLNLKPHQGRLEQAKDFTSQPRRLRNQVKDYKKNDPVDLDPRSSYKSIILLADYIRCFPTEIGDPVTKISLADYGGSAFLQSPRGYADTCDWFFEAETATNNLQLEVVYLQVSRCCCLVLLRNIEKHKICI